MADYYHYNYQCPYISSTDATKIYCEDGCRLTFETISECRKYLRQYCADCKGWEKCSIARTKTDHIYRKLDMQAAVKRMMNGK